MCSSDLKKNGLRISLYGSRGSAHWCQETPNEISESDEKGRTETLNYSSPGIIEASKERYARFKVGHPIGFIEAFANLYEDIFGSLSGILSSKDFTFGTEEASRGIATLEAIHTSSLQKTWVSVSTITRSKHT